MTSCGVMVLFHYVDSWYEGIGVKSAKRRRHLTMMSFHILSWHVWAKSTTFNMSQQPGWVNYFDPIESNWDPIEILSPKQTFQKLLWMIFVPQIKAETPHFRFYDATIKILIQWIGSREISNRKAPYSMGKSIVSCRFSLTKNQSIDFHISKAARVGSLGWSYEKRFPGTGGVTNI